MMSTQEELKEGGLKTETTNNLSPEEILMLQEMAEAGLLYGLSKSKTHPAMKSNIFATRSGFEVINLESTIKLLPKVAEFFKNISVSGRSILIVGTSPSVKATVKEFAESNNQPYVSERWLGGTLTNFKAISERVKYYNKLMADSESGALNKYTKKERVLLDKKLAKMKLHFEGIANMAEMPVALFVIDPQTNEIAINEAKVMNIPVVVLANTDTNPKIVSYVIPCNNRLEQGVKWMLKHFEPVLKRQVVIPVQPKIVGARN